MIECLHCGNGAKRIKFGFTPDGFGKQEYQCKTCGFTTIRYYVLSSQEVRNKEGKLVHRRYL